MASGQVSPQALMPEKLFNAKIDILKARGGKLARFVLQNPKTVPKQSPKQSQNCSQNSPQTYHKQSPKQSPNSVQTVPKQAIQCGIAETINQNKMLYAEVVEQRKTQTAPGLCFQ